MQPVAPRGPVYRIYGCSGVELVRQLACTKRAGLYFNIRRRSSARAAVPIDARQGAEVVGCWGLRGLCEPRDAFIFRLGLVSPRRLQRTPDVNERHALLASAEAVLFLWQDGVGPGLPAWRAIPVSSRCLRMYSMILVEACGMHSPRCLPQSVASSPLPLKTGWGLSWNANLRKAVGPHMTHKCQQSVCSEDMPARAQAALRSMDRKRRHPQCLRHTCAGGIRTDAKQAPARQVVIIVKYL